MTLQGEASHPSHCEDCDTELNLEVLHSNAGYYIGTQCACGPYSRESQYYDTRKAAEQALREGTFHR